MSSKMEVVNDFAKDIACLNPIYEKLSDINIFEILKVDQMETKHSNFLAWLLDPASSSGLGDKLLKRLLLFCSENNEKNPNAKNSLSAVDIELMNLDDNVVVKREATTAAKGQRGKHLDLLIFSDKEGFCICIENKINADESKNQLTSYHSYIEKEFATKDTKVYTKFKYENRYYILLSPTGNEANEDDDQINWIALSYADLFDWITDILNTYEESVPERAKSLIKDYLKALERIIDGPFKETCEDIYINHADAFKIFETNRKKDRSASDNKNKEEQLYYKHKEAIDLVLDNRTEISEKIKHRLIEALEDHGLHVKYDSRRAPAYLKVPTDQIEDSRLVDINCEDIKGDFLIFKLYYNPGQKRYDVILRSQGKLCPNTFDSVKYGKDLTNDVDITRKVIKKASNQTIADYIAKLEHGSKMPSKDDDFIKALADEISNAMRTLWKKERVNILNAI